MKLAFLYAGQGTQHPGMGQDLYETYPAFRQVLDSAQLDFDLKELCFEGPEEKLSQTQYTQPCMVAFAAGLTAVLRERGILPELAAGLSLGEYSALHAAGVFDADTAVELVKNGDTGIPVPDYTDENVSDKVVRLIQSYTGVVDKMVWRKS